MKSLFSLIALSLVTLLANANPIAPNFNGCPGGSKVDVPAGTLVILETNERLPAQAATLGKLVQMRVRTNVVVDGKIVIRTGSQAVGRVKGIETGTFNDPGTITVELFYVQAVDGNQIPLNGNEQTITAINGAGTAADVPINTMMTAQLMNNEEVDAH